MMQSFEGYVKKALDGARDGSGKSAQKSLTERNSVKAMVTAGSDRRDPASIYLRLLLASASRVLKVSASPSVSRSALSRTS